MLFDQYSCQLHPNDAGRPPAALSVERDFAGHRRFHTTVTLPAKARGSVKFSFEVHDGASGKCLGRGDWIVAPGGRATSEVALPLLFGRHRVTLRTEMAEAGGDSFHAWAHWIEPQFM
jgi:hypothetical protein